MLIRWPIWVALALVGSVVAPLTVFARYGHHPTSADLGNPVTLPVELTRQILGSADAFDRDTAILVNQQTELGARLAALRLLVGDLDRLETTTGRLADVTGTLSDRAAQTGTAAGRLDPPLAALTDRAGQGTATNGALAGTVTQLNNALQAASAGLQRLLPELQALGPPANALALEEVVRDTAVLGQLRSLAPR